MTAIPSEQAKFPEFWWKAYFEWHPFKIGDAAQEEHLEEYFIEPPLFWEITGRAHSILYAPLGGGKTATRIMVERMCEVGEIEGVMPVTCDDFSRVLEEAEGDPSLVTEDMLVEEVMHKAAVKVLNLLMKEPEIAGEIPDALLKWVAVYPSDYEWEKGLEEHLRRMELSVAEFRRLVGEGKLDALKGSDYPGLETLARLETLRDSGGITPELTPREKLQGLVEIAKFLGFEAVYVLLDGVDGLPETRAPQNCAAMVKPLLDSITLLSVPGLYFKLFLPSETRPFLAHTAGIQSRRVTQAELDWTKKKMRELLRERLRAASNGTVESLDALCEPALRGRIDAELIELAENPRHLIALGRRLFEEHKEGLQITKEEFNKVRVFEEKRVVEPTVQKQVLFRPSVILKSPLWVSVLLLIIPFLLIFSIITGWRWGGYIVLLLTGLVFLMIIVTELKKRS